MDTRTKIIVMLLCGSVLCVGIMAFIGAANPKVVEKIKIVEVASTDSQQPTPTQEVTEQVLDDVVVAVTEPEETAEQEGPEATQEVVQEESISMPGMTGELNYNDTPEGQAELKRLGWEGRDDVQLRPDVVSLTHDEVMEHFNATLERAKSSPIQFDPNYTIDDMQCMPNMQWVSVFRGMDYIVISSIAAQYAESVGADPNTVDCDFTPEHFDLDNGDSGFVFYCDGKAVTMGYNYLSDQWCGYIYSIEDM